MHRQLSIRRAKFVCVSYCWLSYREFCLPPGCR
jgi:hypothetical protein